MILTGLEMYKDAETGKFKEALNSDKLHHIPQLMDSSTQRSFSFVNLQHPDDLKNEETQSLIRRLAMTEVGKARRKPKTKKARNDIVLSLRPDFDRLGAGSIDPFTSYPITLDSSSRNLLANIFDGNTNHPTTLRGCWYPVGLSSASAFHNMLANSQKLIFGQRNGYYPSQDDALALSHHHKALRAASDMMRDPARQNSDEAIGAVVSFMCHHALLGSFAGWRVGKTSDALDKMIAIRGGYDRIEKDYLRITLSWIDLMSTFAQDIPPSAPLPTQWLLPAPNSPHPLPPISLAWKLHLPTHTSWISIFDSTLQHLSLTPDQLALSASRGCWLEPTLWRLLTLRPLQQGSDRGHVMEEVCRLGTLLFLAPIWRFLGHSPVWTSAISHNLLLVLRSHMIEWKELKPLLVWTIYFGAVETRDLEERGRLVFMLGIVMAGMGIGRWEDLMEVVKSVMWVAEVCNGTDEVICEEIMGFVGRNRMPLVVAEEYVGEVMQEQAC